MSGYCSDCGNTFCICGEIEKEKLEMDKETMSHMNEQWYAIWGESHWIIKARGGFNICDVCGCLPNDDSGAYTAQAICDAHNKAPANSVHVKLLEGAQCILDPCTWRGKLCRGAYIVNDNMYLNTDNKWTDFRKDDSYWWYDLLAAEKFLAKAKERVGL